MDSIFNIVRAGDRLNIERLISTGEATPDLKDGNGNTLLHIAVEVKRKRKHHSDSWAGLSRKKFNNNYPKNHHYKQVINSVFFVQKAYNQHSVPNQFYWWTGVIIQKD